MIIISKKKTIDKIKKDKIPKTDWEFEIGEEALYVRGLYDELFGTKIIIIDRSRKHISQYYKVKAYDGFEFTISNTAMEKIEKEENHE